MNKIHLASQEGGFGHLAVRFDLHGVCQASSLERSDSVAQGGEDFPARDKRACPAGAQLPFEMLASSLQFHQG